MAGTDDVALKLFYGLDMYEIVVLLTRHRLKTKTHRGDLIRLVFRLILDASGNVDVEEFDEIGIDELKRPFLTFCVVPAGGAYECCTKLKELLELHLAGVPVRTPGWSELVHVFFLSEDFGREFEKLVAPKILKVITRVLQEQTPGLKEQLFVTQREYPGP